MDSKQKENENLDGLNKQAGESAHASFVNNLVDSLMKKLGFTCSIDHLVKLYHSSSFPVITEDIWDSSVTSCSYGELEEWINILVCIYTSHPFFVFRTTCVCPRCGERLVHLYYRTADWTWRGLHGREGEMMICPNCPDIKSLEITKIN